MYGAVRKFCPKAQSWLIFCDLSALHLGHVQQKIAQPATYEVEVMMITHKIEKHEMQTFFSYSSKVPVSKRGKWDQRSQPRDLG